MDDPGKNGERHGRRHGSGGWRAKHHRGDDARLENGESKLLPQCTLPLTGAGCIRRVLTDLALLEISDGAFVLREYAPGVSIDEIARKTAGRLVIADDVREMRFTKEAI